MSGTGSTNFPQGPRFENNQSPRSVPTMFNGSLIGVPNVNKGAENKVQKLSGQVIQQNDKGQVRIQTEKGIVEIQLPKDAPQREQPLKQGQQVSIEIPPTKVRDSNPNSVKIEIPANEGPVKAKTPQAQTQDPATNVPKQQIAESSNNTRPVEQPPVKKTTQDLKSLANIPTQNSIQSQQLVGETVRLDPISTSVNLQEFIQQPTQIKQVLTQTALQQTPLILTSASDLQSTIITEKPSLNANTENSIIDLPSSTNSAPILIDISAAKIASIQQSTSSLITSLIPEDNTSIAFKNVAAQLISLKNLPVELKATKNTLDVLPTNPETSAPVIAKIERIEIPFVAFTDADQPTPNFKGFIETTKFSNKPSERILLESIPTRDTQSVFVIGKTQNNLPIVTSLPTNDIPKLDFILQIPVQDLNIGQRLDITAQTITSAISTSLSGPPAPLPPPAYFLIPDQWPLMQDIVQSLKQTSAIAAQNVTSVVPNAANPAQIAPAALFFIAALRVGDLSSILSDRALSILKSQNKGNLLSRLSQEGNIINRTEQSTGEWRSLTLPMVSESEIQKIALHYKQDQQDDNSDDHGDKQTRFIFDVALSRMGKVQLDGLHRDNKLNLIIRTEQSISQAMQASMKQAYQESLEGTELKGELSFQNNLDSWVSINVQEHGEYSSDI